MRQRGRRRLAAGAVGHAVGAVVRGAERRVGRGADVDADGVAVVAQAQAAQHVGDDAADGAAGQPAAVHQSEAAHAPLHQRPRPEAGRRAHPQGGTGGLAKCAKKRLFYTLE